MTLPGTRWNLCTPSKPTAPPSLSLRTSAHAGVAIRSPASRRLARPVRGAILARVHDRPRGRCNAAALRGTDCHVAALLAMTGSGAWCVGARVPGRFAGARRGRAPALRVHDRSRVRWAGCIAETRTVGRGLAPAVSFPEPPRCLQTHRTPRPVIANQRARGCGYPFPRKPHGLRAPAGAQHRPGQLTGPAAGAMRSHCLGGGLPRRCAPRNDGSGSRCLRTELPGKLVAAGRVMTLPYRTSPAVHP